MGSPEEYPAFSIQTTEGEMVLHWFNTRLRTFKDPTFNHVEWRTEEGELRGLKVGEGLMDLLFENDFPYQYDPVLDESTANWYTTTEANHLDEELLGLLGD